MNIERLERLSDLLFEHANDRQFSLDFWDCGTTHCAVGLACLDPWFNEQGLVLNESTKSPMYGKLDSWHAVEAFFELTRVQSQYIFASFSYPIGVKPADVMRRIDDMLWEAKNAD